MRRARLLDRFPLANDADIFRGFIAPGRFVEYRARPTMISASLETTRRNFVNEHAARTARGFQIYPALSFSFSFLPSRVSSLPDVPLAFCQENRTRRINSARSITSVTDMSLSLWDLLDESTM